MRLSAARLGDHPAIGARAVGAVSWDSDGTVIFGPSTNIDLADGKHSYPAVGYISGDGLGLPRWYPRGGVFLMEIDDPPELVGRRTAGNPLTNELAQAVTTVNIADVTAFAGAGTITVDSLGSADNWSTSGTLILRTAGGEIAVCTYTGIDIGTGVISGVTHVRNGGTTAYGIGSSVSEAIDSGIGVFAIYGQAGLGRLTGFQDRVGQITFTTREPQTPDGYSGFHSAGRLDFYTTSPGPNSQRRLGMSLLENSNLGLTGAWARDPTPSDMKRRLTVAAHLCRVTATVAADAASIPVDSPAGMPTAGVVIVDNDIGGDETITYTGWSATAGQWYLTGCTGGTGSVRTLPNGTYVELAKTNLGTVIGAIGNITAHDLTADPRIVTIGVVGSAGEGGLMVGTAGGGNAGFMMKRSAAREAWLRNNEDTVDADLRLAKLTASDKVQVTVADEALLCAPATGTSRTYGRFANTGGALFLGVESSGGGSVFGGAPAYASFVGTAGATALALGTNATTRVSIGSGGDVTLADAVNVITNATTGTRWGTASTQKQGWWGATPIVQPSGTAAAATDLATVITLANDLRTKLLATGLVA